MRASVLGIVVAVAALGVVGGPVADAPCAGPLLQVRPATFTPVPRDSSDPTAEPVWGVRAGERVNVEASNLGPCRDTYAMSDGGCSPDLVEPPDETGSARRVSLILEQGSRRWSVGSADVRPPAYELTFGVDLPDGLAPGPARLRLTGAVLGDAEIALRVA